MATTIFFLSSTFWVAHQFERLVCRILHPLYIQILANPKYHSSSEGNKLDLPCTQLYFTQIFVKILFVKKLFFYILHKDPFSFFWVHSPSFIKYFLIDCKNSSAFLQVLRLQSYSGILSCVTRCFSLAIISLIWWQVIFSSFSLLYEAFSSLCAQQIKLQMVYFVTIRFSTECSVLSTWVTIVNIWLLQKGYYTFLVMHYLRWSPQHGSL